MDTAESIEFGNDSSQQRTFPRRLMWVAGISATLAAGIWCQQNSDGPKPAAHAEAAPPASITIDTHGSKLVFTALGSFLRSKGGSHQVETEWSNLNCRHHSIHGEMFVNVDSRTMLHNSNVVLPQNSLTFACLLTGEVNASAQPWITIGHNDFHYKVTDAGPPAKS